MTISDELVRDCAAIQRVPQDTFLFWVRAMVCMVPKLPAHMFGPYHEHSGRFEPWRIQTCRKRNRR
jgi:hypothetical protein